jgi:DNA topoisomerase-2
MKYIFNVEDNELLPRYDDVEEGDNPQYLAPIIPMILVNGAEGIGTGYRCAVPPYNPDELIQSLISKLTGDEYPELIPYYHGFLGSIVENPSCKGSYDCYGSWEVSKTEKKKIIHIHDIPLSRYYDDDYYEKLVEDKEKIGYTKLDKRLVQDEERHTRLEYTLEFPRGIPTDDIIANLKLIDNKYISTSCMYLYDRTGHLKKYATVYEILDDFIEFRLDIYEERRLRHIAKLEYQIMILQNIIRMIKEHRAGKLKFIEMSESELVSYFTKNKYDKADDGTYRYMTNMRVVDIVKDNMEKRQKKLDELIAELEEYKKLTAKKLWINELKHLSEFETLRVFPPEKE